MRTHTLFRLSLALWLGIAANALAQATTAFTYQGQLQDGATSLNGLYDFHFTVWNLDSGGVQVGPAVAPVAVPVSNGLFTVTLDFGAGVFDGGARWLAINVKTNLAPAYTPLTPRQRLTPSPYALYAGTAGTAIPADNSVTSIKITDGQVMTVDLANNAVTTGKILDGTILSADLADGSVTTSKIADGNVTTAKLPDGSVPTPKLADGAVNSLKIADGTVASADLASDAASLAKVTANRLANSGDNVLVQGSGNPINTATLFTGMGFQYQTSTGEGAIMAAFNSLPAGQGYLSFYTKGLGQPITQRMVIDPVGNVGINKSAPTSTLDVNGTVTATGFVGPGAGLTGVVPADNSVTSAKILDGQVQNADLANNSVNSAKIADGTILGADLAPGSVATVNLANNAVTSAKIADASILALDIGAGQVVKSLNLLRDDVTLAPGANLTISTAGSTLTLATPDDWHLLGNASTTPGTHFLGTTDSQPLWLKVQNNVGWRLVPSAANSTEPNILGGAIGNTMFANAKGTVIAGGVSNAVPAAVYYGFLGGGFGNSLSFSGSYADYAVLAGGYSNITWGTYSVLGGGMGNTNSGEYSTIPGGYRNFAAGDFSFAAGRQAKAAHQGAFVWADSQAADFVSTANNQFLIRATGNVGVNKNNPGTALDVNGTVTANGFVGPGLGLTGVVPADNSVTSVKIQDGSVLAVDLANDSGSLAKVTAGTMTDAGSTIGIGTIAPGAVLDVYGTRNISGSSDGIVNVGDTAGYHVTLDNNELHARNGAASASLFLNDFGGDVFVGGGGGNVSLGSGDLFVDSAANRVGIGTSSPTAKLHVAGTPGTDGVKFPDGTLQTTAPKPVFNSGLGSSPAGTNRFLGPSVTVTVTSASQQILVTSHKALGSTVGASDLRLYIGYRSAGTTAEPTNVGAGIFGNKVLAGTRMPMGMSGVITGLAPGSYEVGLTGFVDVPAQVANWNSNEYGYTTAVVY